MIETTPETKPDHKSATLAGALAGEVARLREENRRLREELRREHEMYLRNLADFDNYHRRAERERAQAAQAGKRELILALLGVVDDFERALQQAPALTDSLHSVYRRLISLLAAEGVTAFESVGEHFDPAWHEAVSLTESGEAGPGVVLEEIRRGYRWGAELLRPAQVRVAQ